MNFEKCPRCKLNWSNNNVIIEWQNIPTKYGICSACNLEFDHDDNSLWLNIGNYFIVWNFNENNTKVLYDGCSIILGKSLLPFDISLKRIENLIVFI